MFTYITTTTVPSFTEIQTAYDLTPEQVNWTFAIPALGLAFGPLFWSSFADIYGRRLIFLLGTVIALVSTCGSAVASSYSGYMAARFFQGFGVSPAATVGMAVVGDLFFEYERGQKLGLWVLAIDTGLLVGPIIGGFMDLVGPVWIQWLSALLFALLLVLELALMPETLYPRNTMLARLPMARAGNGLEEVDLEKVGRARAEVGEVGLKRTKALPFVNVKPVPGLRHPKPWDSVLRFILTFKFLVVSISVLIYCFAWYWWILTVITMIPLAYSQYSPQIQGLLFIGLLLGTVISEVFFSGRLSDWLMVKLAKKNNNVRVPEMRLWLGYPAALLSASKYHSVFRSLDRPGY